MTAESDKPPELFWISGSPPSWRVMLAMTVKDIAFASHRLESSKNEHKTPEFLALNPRGQVPVLRHGDVIVRESIAVLAYLDAQWRERPLFGVTPSVTGKIWQAVMDFESNLRPHLTTIAGVLFRGEAASRAAELAQAVDRTRVELTTIDKLLGDHPFVAGDTLTAADCVVFPGLAWLKRALVKSARKDIGEQLLLGRYSTDRWVARIEAIPGFDSTYPPHWR